MLDLYQRRFEGRRLRPDEYVICADEKTQLQALGRRHPTLPPSAGPAGPGRVRVRAQRHPRLPRRLGRPPRQPVRPRRGQDRDRPVRPPRRAGDDASSRTPRPAPSTGSSTTAAPTPARPRSSGSRRRWTNARLIHLPIHASWLNQIELYFSIVQRKALTPNDFDSLDALAERLLALRRPLPPDRPPVRMDVHPHRPRPAPRTNRRPRTRPQASPHDRTCGRVY